MRSLQGVVGAAAIVATVFAGPAAAKTYAFLYTATSGYGPTTVSGRMTVARPLNAVGGHDIQRVTGAAGGDVVTGLAPNPNQPYDTLQEPEENYDFDNVLYDSAPRLDFFGVLFHSATTDYNLFTDAGPTDFVLLSSPRGVALGIDDFHVTPYPGYSHGDLVLTAVPEPTAWVLLLSGFGLAAAAFRRGRIWKTAPSALDGDA